MKWVLLLFLTTLLLVACARLPAFGLKQEDQSVAGQLRGNQALLLVLQNSADLDHLYFYGLADDRNDAWAGIGDAGQQNVPIPGDTGCIGDASQQNCFSDIVPIGELNLLLQNVGGSGTAGGLYVSGYDPNLIKISSRLGQNSITEGVSTNCYNNIRIFNTGKYSVTRVCADPRDFKYGFDVRGGDGGVDSVTGSVGGDTISGWADWVLSRVTQRDVDFFTKYGIFDSGDIVTCGVQDGQAGCTINFDASAYNPFRASYGRLLLNTVGYGELASCSNRCRIFPPGAPTKILEGVSAEYPVGDALFYDYDIWLDRSKWNPRIEQLKQTFQVTACYFYTTSATPSVCVDPDPTVSRNEPCTTAPITFRESQGAPVKISRIEQRAQSGAIAYTLFIEHVGNGEVWLPGAFQQCGPYLPDRPDYRMRDAVQVLDVRMSGDLRQLRCLPDTAKGEHIVRLQNGKGQITCLYPVDPRVTGGSRQAYTSALSVEIGYVYQNIIKKDVIIHRT